MPYTETIERTVYKLDELSDGAKEHARDKYREHALDDGWWEYVYDDANTIAALMGIEISQKPIKLMNGGTRYDPKIWFNGFSSQGDGACFEGYYSFKAGAIEAVKDRAPLDIELHRIAQAITNAQKVNGFKLSASIVHRGHYYHEMSVEIDVEKDAATDIAAGTDDALIEALRDFMRWIYRQLEAEHDYQLSDEVIDETILANEYEFDEDGNSI